MKTRSVWPIFILILFPVSGWSQSSEKPQKKRESDYAVESYLRSPQPDEDQLRGFELRATQKLEDFMDFVKIISNSDYPESLREHAREMAIKLFVSDSTRIAFLLPGTHRDTVIPVSGLLNLLLYEKDLRIDPALSSFRISEPLQEIPKGEYAGKIAYIQLSRFFNEDPGGSEPIRRLFEGDILLRKIPKNFGYETRDVWEVSLGNIRLVE
jgi:hypothetical protein